MLGNEELAPKPVSEKSEEYSEEEFNRLPDKEYIQNIHKDPGLFGPIRGDIEGKYKEYADVARNQLGRLYDLYKGGDVDAVKAVQDYENKTLGRGYNDTPAGQAAKRETLKTYGSKTTMTKSVMWDAFMTLYQNRLGDALEREDVPEHEKPALEAASRFDREGRTTMDLRPVMSKLGR
jgi:hypothetical protein